MKPERISEINYRRRAINTMEKVNEKDKQFRSGDWGPKYLIRGPLMEWGILVLKANRSLGAHLHNETEETFYFLEGHPKIIVDDAEYRVEAGDAFRIEPKEKHDIINDTDILIKAIFMKCPYNPEDKVSC